MRDVTVHELKTEGVYWDAINAGEKTFEVRRNDRFFQRGDIVKLIRIENARECSRRSDDEPDDAIQIERFKRRVITREIGSILQGGQFGVEPGHCVFSLLPAPTTIICAPRVHVMAAENKKDIGAR